MELLPVISIVPLPMLFQIKEFPFAIVAVRGIVLTFSQYILVGFILTFGAAIILNDLKSLELGHTVAPLAKAVTLTVEFVFSAKLGKYIMSDNVFFFIMPEPIVQLIFE